MGPKKIKEYIYNDEIELYDRFFIINLYSVIGILALTTLEIIFVKSMIATSLGTLGLIIALLFIGSISYKKQRMDKGAIVFCSILVLAYFPITFLNGGGISGVGPIWFVFITFLIGITIRGRERYPLFFLLDLISVICFAIAYMMPEWIPNRTSLMSYVYKYTTLFFIAMAIVVMLTFEKDCYEKANAKAKKQREEIENLNAAQNRFFSSMSHEIRTPINTIIGLNEMILRENISDEIAEDAVNIRAAGKMLLNTINDILDMSKFQAGDMKLLVEAYNTGNMLSDLVGMLWIRAKEKNLEFHINVAPDLPAELLGDEVRIKQILMNILNNAIKYTKQGSVSLSVECERQDNGVVNMIYTVKDTGMGIKKDDIPYLFTAFKRVDEGANKHIEGTGLGLSIVKEFLQLMGGKVTVNSVYTKGSTFVIEIPQKAASDKELGEYDYERKHKLKSRKAYRQKFEAPKARILVVDDNEANLMVVTKLLRETKVQIDTVKSGREALQKTLDTEYNLIFMDHLMPEMDGVECFEKIRNQTGGKNKETSIVVLTANAGEENRVLYATAGFNGYLVKPVTGEDLESEVLRFLPMELVRITGDGEVVEDTITWMKNAQKKRRVAITTESVADLPMELLKKYGIAVISHRVRTSEGTFFKDGIEIDTPGVLKYMENMDHVMYPLPPSVEEYEAFYAEQLVLANNIIHISISSDVENSGCPNAVEAAGSFDNVTVFDSRHLSSSQGMVAMAASRMAEAGMGVDEIVMRLHRIVARIRTSFLVDDLEYLSRTKQVTNRRAALIRALLAKPMLVVKDGRMMAKKFLFGSKERVWKQYIDSILGHTKADSIVVFVTYVGLSKKELEYIGSCIEKNAKFDKIVYQQASPAIAANCGPGTFGVLFIEKA